MTSMAHKAWVLFASAGLTAAAVAQSGPVGQPRPQGTEQQGQEKNGARRISIDFPGGKLREYIAALREATRPESVNVVAPESLLNMRLGEISMREVEVKTAVEALSWAAEPRGTMMVQAIGPNSFGVANGRMEADSVPGAPRPAGATQIQVLSLRDLTEPLPGDPPNAHFTVDPDVVITAVRTALQTGGDPENTEMKYHADSGLLIVRGTTSQIVAASNVVSSIQNDMRSRRKSLKEAMAGQVNLDEFRAEVEKHAIRERLLEANLMRAQEEVSKLEAMRKEGAVSPEDVTSARASFDRSKAELETARIERAMAQAKLGSMEKRIADAAAREGRGDEGLGDIPAGRSVTEYTSASITGKDLKATAAALESLAGQLLRGQGGVGVRAEGDTLIVTGGPEAQRIVRRALLDPANPAKGPIVQKSRPRALTEEKPSR